MPLEGYKGPDNIESQSGIDDIPLFCGKIKKELISIH